MGCCQSTNTEKELAELAASNGSSGANSNNNDNRKNPAQTQTDIDGTYIPQNDHTTNIPSRPRSTSKSPLTANDAMADTHNDNTTNEPNDHSNPSHHPPTIQEEPNPQTLPNGNIKELIDSSPNALQTMQSIPNPKVNVNVSMRITIEDIDASELFKSPSSDDNSMILMEHEKSSTFIELNKTSQKHSENTNEPSVNSLSNTSNYIDANTPLSLNANDNDSISMPSPTTPDNHHTNLGALGIVQEDEHLVDYQSVQMMKKLTADSNDSNSTPRNGPALSNIPTASIDFSQDFGDNSHLTIGNNVSTLVADNHGYGSSVVINSEEDIKRITANALPVERMGQHYLTDSVESLDPDFVLEPAYFEGYDPLPPPSPSSASTVVAAPVVVSAAAAASSNSNLLSPSLSVAHAPGHSVQLSKDMAGIGGSIQWTKPGVSIDHSRSIQMMQSIEMKAAPSSMLPNKIGKSIDLLTNDHKDGGDVKSNVVAARSMGGEEMVQWQIHGRKLRHMTHEALMEWLDSSGFDEETVKNFRQKKIDGKKLWSNIRNASMFLYNVGVVRPTLRDAIVQNIYLELLPKTPGFSERHMSDFTRLKLIADGPISTVYKAVIRKEKLKLRESTVVIKGYHFCADDVRVGKIIQILVHVVTHINSNRFVRIHGFIRNMMEHMSSISDSNFKQPQFVSATTNAYQERPMFGIVMEYCDTGSIHSMRSDKISSYYRYNMMDKLGILIDIAMAMEELHALNILHRNLKSSNVLLTEDEDIKLTDYCLDVTQITDFTHSVQAKERSIRWMAPELIANAGQYSTKSDVYAFGITAYEILSGHKPYHTIIDVEQLLQKLCNSDLRPDIDSLADLPENLLILLEKCWAVDPLKRPEFTDILLELDDVQNEIRKTCVTFDNIYDKARINYSNSRMYKEYQSSPLLISGNDDDGAVSDGVVWGNDDDDDRDDDKFKSLLGPKRRLKPKHSKDDTHLSELRFRPEKKRPRKPLPKAPPMKPLPITNENKNVIKLNNSEVKEIYNPDRPLPQPPTQ